MINKEGRALNNSHDPERKQNTRRVRKERSAEQNSLVTAANRLRSTCGLDPPNSEHDVVRALGARSFITVQKVVLLKLRQREGSHTLVQASAAQQGLFVDPANYPLGQTFQRKEP